MLPPVRDANGFVVWRVRVARGEMTCTACGETTLDGFCVLCNVGDGAVDGRGNVRVASRANLVPTASYLREDEMVLVG